MKRPKTPDLDNLFNPRSIAFVGATQMKIKWGFIVFNNLVSGGYAGDLYPVNPGHEEILGFRCYPTVRDIPGEVDLAIFTVPARAVMATMDDCAAKGVKAALVISAGFRELGEEGAALEQELVAKAADAGMLLAGPNGQGLCCPANKLYPWMPIFYPPEGRVAFVAQSGNILNMLIGHVLESGLGVSKAVSSGNEAALSTADYISYFAADPHTDAVVSYLESVQQGRRFFEQVASATRTTPVVLIKGGRTDSGVQAARSHTGALAVSQSVFEGACRQAGIMIADSIEDAGLTGGSFVNRPLPGGKRVGIVTGGGGLGVIAADACADAGLTVPALSRETLEKVGAFLPEYWVPGNPVDLVAGLDLTIVKPVLETLLRSGEIDALLFLFIESKQMKGSNVQEKGGVGIDLSGIWNAMTGQLAGVLDELYEVVDEVGVPLYVASNFDIVREVCEEEPAPRNVQVYQDPESACRAIIAMASYHEYLERVGALT